MNGVGETRIGYGRTPATGPNVFILNDSLSWVKGKHSFKFGGEYRLHADQRVARTPGRLYFDFTPDETRFLGQSWSNQTGFGFASFLLGDVHGADQVTSGDLHRPPELRRPLRAGRLPRQRQADLNLGLRWELTGPGRRRTATGRTTTPRRSTPRPGSRDCSSSPRTAARPSRGPATGSQFGPRVGFTYQPTHAAVVRAAYGIFYQGIGMDYWFGVPYGFAPGYRRDQPRRSRRAAASRLQLGQRLPRRRGPPAPRTPTPSRGA